jgi:hypothetical protein
MHDRVAAATVAHPDGGRIGGANSDDPHRERSGAAGSCAVFWAGRRV